MPAPRPIPATELAVGHVLHLGTAGKGTVLAVTRIQVQGLALTVNGVTVELPGSDSVGVRVDAGGVVYSLPIGADETVVVEG